MLEAAVLSLIVALATAYGGHRVIMWARQNARYAGIAGSSMAALMAVTLAPANTFAQSTLEFDISPFFDSLAVYLPIFIGLFAIVGGIAGAIALARYVINAIVDAFKGGSL